MVYILGISCFIHDSSAAIVLDGRLIAACEEERFTRVKHCDAFPVNAINFCLDVAGISIDQVDHITFYMKPGFALRKRVPYIVRNLPRSLFFGGKHQRVWWDMVLLRKHLFRHFGIRPYRIHFSEHVLNHAASTFYPSPFEEAAILSIEGCGEWTTTFLGKGRETAITRLKEIEYPHSLGHAYGAVTQFLGFRAWNGEGKVMGLAPYGKPAYIDLFRKIITHEPKGEFRLDLDFFTHHIGKLIWYSNKFIKEFGPPRKPEGEFTENHKNLAASMQLRLEETAQHLTEYLYEQTGTANLCLAGGVALNSSMNGTILAGSPFKNIFVQPAAHDAGCSVGSSLYLSHMKYKISKRHTWESTFWGPEYSTEEIESTIKDYGWNLIRSDDVAIETAALLEQGLLIGWFQGRMEFGPRALGHRSILADPRKAEMKDILNSRVKFRESFRPFAPSILEERVSEYFQIKQPTPFMQFVTPVRKEKLQEIPAVVHIDGTARVQTISKKQDALYWNLIHEFYTLTGVPVVLNTSFNVRGEPIVNTPGEAIECFLRTGLDVLVLGPFLLKKDKKTRNVI